MRTEAMTWATTMLRGLIGDAIEYRRSHPFRYFLFHRRMAEILQNSPRRIALRRARVRFHALMSERYSARSYALDADLARACDACGR